MTAQQTSAAQSRANFDALTGIIRRHGFSRVNASGLWTYAAGANRAAYAPGEHGAGPGDRPVMTTALRGLGCPSLWFSTPRAAIRSAYSPVSYDEFGTPRGASYAPGEERRPAGSFADRYRARRQRDERTGAWSPAGLNRIRNASERP